MPMLSVAPDAAAHDHEEDRRGMERGT